MRAQSVSRVLLFVIPWTVAGQAPLSMEFLRQEYWSGLSFPSLGIIPTKGSQEMQEIELTSPVFPASTDRFFTTELPENKYLCKSKHIHLKLTQICMWEKDSIR